MQGGSSTTTAELLFRCLITTHFTPFWMCVQVWARRRSGVLPNRTETRQRRIYTPQASRTRRMAVPQPTTSSEETPALWNLPLDGPLKIQPQVPLDNDILEKQVKEVFSKRSHQKQKGNQVKSTGIEINEPRQEGQEDKKSTEEGAQLSEIKRDGR